MHIWKGSLNNSKIPFLCEREILLSCLPDADLMQFRIKKMKYTFHSPSSPPPSKKNGGREQRLNRRCWATRTKCIIANIFQRVSPKIYQNYICNQKHLYLHIRLKICVCFMIPKYCTQTIHETQSCCCGCPPNMSLFLYFVTQQVPWFVTIGNMPR